MRILNTTPPFFLLIMLAGLYFPACKADHTLQPISEKDHFRIQGFRALRSRHQLRLAKDNESGQRLIICGKLLRQHNMTPLKNQFVQIYQADHTGNYNPADPNDKSTARLSGTLQTNDLGMFYLETILPGNGRSPGKGRIHVVVPGADPEVYDIFFREYLGILEKRWLRNSDQYLQADLRMGKDGSVVGFVTMKINTIGR